MCLADVRFGPGTRLLVTFKNFFSYASSLLQCSGAQFSCLNVGLEVRHVPLDLHGICRELAAMTHGAASAVALYAYVWAPSLHVVVSYVVAAVLGQCLHFCKRVWSALRSGDTGLAVLDRRSGFSQAPWEVTAFPGSNICFVVCTTAMLDTCQLPPLFLRGNNSPGQKTASQASRG